MKDIIVKGLIGAYILYYFGKLGAYILTKPINKLVTKLVEEYMF